MYNSSIKGQGKDKKFTQYIEIKGKIFFNDLSKIYMRNEFKTCDVVYSEIAWPYGYKGFNEKAGNVAKSYSCYIENVNRLIEELHVPAFIVCGKNVANKFPNAKRFLTGITTSGTNMSGCQLYVWNYDYKNEGIGGTNILTTFLAKKFNKCLDPSCGYGEHLLKFKDFVACDINRNCLTYLSILFQETQLCKKIE